MTASGKAGLAGGERDFSSVDDLLADLRLGHSEFQLDHFVLAAHGVTLWGAYQQALREIRARKQAQTSDELALRRMKLKARRGERGSVSDDRLKADESQIEIAEAEHAAATLLDGIRDRSREIVHLVERAAALRERLLDDGALTPSRIARLDAEHWYAVVRRRCGFELLANGRIESSTLSLAAALPDDLRKRLGAALQGEARAALMAEAVEEPSPLAALPAAAEGASC